MGILVIKIAVVEGGEGVCVCRDFMQFVMWMKDGLIGVGVAQETPHFNHFIDDNGLIDLPLCGRRFTWYKGDDTSMSRLDRFLLSQDWCLQWPSCFQVALLRGLSDHCPLQLSVDEEDWGPRPTRMLKCWQDLLGYQQFVLENWHSYQITGWGGYVLREKLKLIKTALKEWHSIHTKSIPR